MSLLFRIVRAAHANGTHHKIALDALMRLQGPDAEKWQRLFLKHADVYLEGSKAPDVSFKDFKNHVLHVAEAFWGGAPEKVENWYGHLVTALRAQDWPGAVYAAGVLSHYYSDPLHPFHTGQTEAENSIHRAVEWSISRSYDTLHSLGAARFATLDVPQHDGPHWLKEMTCDGAEFAHRYYEKLIAHYDLTRGVVRPEDGLDEVGRVVIAELLTYAITGFSRILERAVAESGASAPDVPLTVPTLLAALKVPARWITKRLEDAQDRRIVEAMYDELQATGRVEHTLPEDDRVVRDLHKREVLDRVTAHRADRRALRAPEGDPAEARRQQGAAMAARTPVAPVAIAGLAGEAAKPQPKARRRIEIEAELLPYAEGDDMMADGVTTLSGARPAERRVYLTSIDPLERAPSIGPILAGRLAHLGVKTVADFLARKPADLAAQLDDRRIASEDVATWQDQAQLVMEIPGLRGTHAQLLTGAGYRSAARIAAADPVAFSADILKFAATDAGRRVLRDGNTPDVEKIKAWVGVARDALAA